MLRAMKQAVAGASAPIARHVLVLFVVLAAGGCRSPHKDAARSQPAAETAPAQPANATASKDEPPSAASRAQEPPPSDPQAGGDADPADIPPPKDVAAPSKDAKRSPKGVFYKVLIAGKGAAKPTVEDIVKVHYTGWTTDGKMFDSSVQRGQPAEFPLKHLIPGWVDAIPLMSVGEKARFWIPEELAYKGKPGPPQGMLVFDVELLEIMPTK